MTFTLLYTPEARERLEQLNRSGMKQIAERTLLNIASNPYQGTKLTGSMKGLYSARITRRYRILYTISPKQHRVVIVDISHRREAYR